MQVEQKMEISKVQILIRSFLFETKDVVNDPQQAQKWLKSFRDTLNYQEFEQEPLPYALMLLSEASGFNQKQKLNQMMRWAKHELVQAGITNPTKEQIIQKCIEKYPEEFEEVPSETKVSSQTPPRPNQPPKPPRKRPPTLQEVYDFANDHNLDEVDARNWFERNFIERNGVDKNGKPINNWQGALIRSCQADKTKRENKQ